MPIKLQSTAGGSVIIDVPASTATATLTLPANTGNILTTGAGTVGGNLGVTGTLSDGLGNVRRVPLNSQTSAYGLTANDVGQTISITTGGVYVPNAIFSVGDNIVIYNNSNTSQSITPNSGVIMFDAGNTGNGGAKTLAGRGLATVYCVGANSFVISGVGLT